MWLRLWSSYIALKSPFNRQSQVTPHLINSRLVHSLLCPTHISASESPTGAGLVAGITSHVKRSGRGTSSAPHPALGSKDLLGQSAAIVVEETQSPLPLCQHDPPPPPPHWKNDLHNLLSRVRQIHIICNMRIVLVHSVMTVRESERESARGGASMHAAWLKLVHGVNDNRKRCHIERLLGLLRRVCLSPPCLRGALITLPYNYLPTKGPVKVPVK